MNDSQARFATIVAFFALLVALVGSSTTFLVNKDATDSIASARDESRLRNAQSDYDLCYKFSVTIYNDGVEGWHEATLENYRRLLPSLSEESLTNLLEINKRELIKQMDAFDPAACRKLPSLQLISQKDRATLKPASDIETLPRPPDSVSPSIPPNS
jgi:hypothetical protein